MKLAIAAAVSLIVAVPAGAQDHAGHAAGTATPAAAVPAPAAFSLDTPIETIAADPAGKAILEADFPGMTAHPMYDSFKSMSLNQVAPMSGGVITDAALAKAAADFAAKK